MRISARADYALRAAAELAAAGGGPVKGDALATAQAIPHKFLENILADLRHARLVRSQRGADGGYWLAQPAEEISLADVIRAVEGPLASVRGEAPEDVEYPGAAEHLQDDLDRRPRQPARGRRARHARRPRRRASCRRRSSGSGTTPRRGSRADRPAGGAATRSSPPRARARRPRRASAEPRPPRRPSARPRPAPRSRGARRAGPSPPPSRPPGGAESAMSCGRTSSPPTVETGPEEAHHELVGRLVVELARRADLLDLAVAQHARSGRRPPSPPPGRA